MNILAIDTSSSYASIAVARDDQIAAESHFGTNRTLSARLLPEINRLLELAGLAVSEIDLFGCALGPGSFTGVRAGAATIQGLALATGAPCAGFSTLAMLAMNVPLASAPVCTLLDARKNEVYAGLYDCSGELPVPLLDDCVISPNTLSERLAPYADRQVICVGDGARVYRQELLALLGDRILFAPASCTAGRAANGIMLARHLHQTGNCVAPELLLPHYIRPSEAELNKKSSA